MTSLVSEIQVSRWSGLGQVFNPNPDLELPSEIVCILMTLS